MWETLIGKAFYINTESERAVRVYQKFFAERTQNLFTGLLLNGERENRKRH